MNGRACHDATRVSRSTRRAGSGQCCHALRELLDYNHDPQVTRAAAAVRVETGSR